ncbi:probable sucrose-phosphate synthase 1 [Fagus crenata]
MCQFIKKKYYIINKLNTHYPIIFNNVDTFMLISLLIFLLRKRKSICWSYSEPTEILNTLDPEDSMEEHGESSGAYIIRIPFGPKDKYIPKELLWPYIPEFVDGALHHVIQMSKALGEQIGNGQPVWPVAIHGHYADAGDSAALLSRALNVPMLFTGHSLGRDKLEQLLKQDGNQEKR